MKTRSQEIVFALLMLLIPAVDAATLNIQQDVDLETAYNGVTIYQMFNNVPLTAVEAGDVVNLTFNFVNGRPIVTNPSVIPNELDYVIPGLVIAGLDQCTFGISNIRVNFLDAVATGGAQTEFSLGSQSQLNAQSGLVPALVDFLPSESSLTFSGIQTSYHVDFLNSSSYISFFAPFLLVVADQVEVTPIPEPSFYTLAATSLLVGGKLIRRSRKKPQLGRQNDLICL
ncbi:MAG: hypothetical protein QM813_05275 [Verrucomicrobiota bacterium]